MPLVLAAPIGLIVGIVMGALGGGGAVLTVPILVFGFDLTPLHATTASVVIVGAGAIAGVAVHHRAGRVRWSEGHILGILGAPATALGAVFSRTADPNVLLLAFAVLLLAISVLMFRRASSDAADRPTPDPIFTLRPLRVDWVRVLPLVATASGIGLLTGFFGVGGGFAVVPALVLLLGFSMPAATATSLLVILWNSVVALISRLVGGIDPDWALIGAFAAAVVVGNIIGGRITGIAKPQTMQRGFAVLLVLIAIYTGVAAGTALA